MYSSFPILVSSLDSKNFAKIPIAIVAIVIISIFPPMNIRAAGFLRRLNPNKQRFSEDESSQKPRHDYESYERLSCRIIVFVSPIPVFLGSDLSFLISCINVFTICGLYSPL